MYHDINNIIILIIWYQEPKIPNFLFSLGRHLPHPIFLFTITNMSSSPAYHSETINVSDNQTILNVNMTNVTKLTSTNFVMWSRQVHALFDGYDLAGFIDGSVIIPPPTLTTEGTIATNPAYTLWKRQDRLLYSALLGAISTSLQPILSTATTAAEI